MPAGAGIGVLSACLVVAAHAVAGAAAPVPQVRDEDFRRSDRFLLGTPDHDVLNAEIAFQWIGAGDSFHYRSQRRDGTRYLRVQSATGRAVALFDHEAMAAALSPALGTEARASDLPIEQVTLLGDDRYLVVSDGKRLHCDLHARTCAVQPKAQGEMPSPDGRYSIIPRNYNLWLRDNRSGAERALTTDGVSGWSYGLQPESSGMEISNRRSGERGAVVALWAPDSRRFVSYRLDERPVPQLALVQALPEDGAFRPRLHLYHYDLVGDTPAQAELFVYDIDKDARTAVQYPPMPSTFLTPIALSRLWWSADSHKLHLVDAPFGQSYVKLLEIDAGSGSVRPVIEEHAANTYFPNAYFLGPPSIHVLSSGDVIWFSERTGWGHLYRYDGRSGKLKGAITQGEWLVRDILSVDERAGYIYFSASGREAGEDVYNRHLYRAKLDGSGLRLLTPERGDHDFPSRIAPEVASMNQLSELSMAAPRISPNGKYVMDHFSSASAPGHWVLRRSDGSLIARLEDEDPSPLPPYTAPEPFVVRSADGQFDLYGVLSRPPDFDPGKRYPVIDYIYPGPQIIRAPKGFATGLMGGAILGDAQALADLGFVVIQVDGRGGPFRSKAFRDLSYGHMEQAGTLEDHVASLRQLARTRPWLDLDRVGIFGTSGGGFATVHALLDYPDFFKVGVASAGNYEQRSYLRLWGETYHGLPGIVDYDPVFAGRNAGNLKGKLLLAHGEMDDNVHPANLMRLVDRLIRSNKQFDMLMMPNVNHGIGTNPYFQRVRQLYFLKHLMGAQLPSESDLVLPQATVPGAAH